MIETAVLREDPWSPDTDWEALATRAVLAAIERTPQADWVSQPDLLDAVTQGSDDGEVLLGDIVLAHDVCAAEAAEKGVSMIDHATHLIVHGTLHLLGHDHGSDAEAEVMEGLERAALQTLGIADPYLIRED